MLGDVVTRVLSVLREEPALQRVRIECEAAVNSGQIVGDDGQLEHLVINLILNAAQASRDGGVVQVKVDGAKEWVRLLVRDDGVGMAKDVRERAFEPFFHHQVQGHGVGIVDLPADRGCARREHSIDSELGRGTTVTVDLPSGPRSGGAQDLAMSVRVLIVEDENLIRWSLRQKFEARGFTVTDVDRAQAAREALNGNVFDLAMLDYKLPDATGLELLREIRETDTDVVVIMLTAFSSIESARRCDEAWSVRLHHQAVRHERSAADGGQGGGDHQAAPRGAGTSPPGAARVRGGADHRPTRVHDRAVRRDRPGGQERSVDGVFARRFGDGQGSGGAGYPLQLGACRPTVYEHHLHGAFRVVAGERAVRSREGGVHRRQGDEKGSVRAGRRRDDLPRRGGRHAPGVAGQAAALPRRANVPPRGGTKELSVDVRVIAATNRDIDKAIADGKFRADLMFRLNVIPIPLPPLRTRGDDVRLLAQHFVTGFSREFRKPISNITEAAYKRLQAYAWPGNVRELRNVLERAVLLCRGDVIDAADLVLGPIDPSKTSQSASEVTLPDAGLDLRELETSLLRQRWRRPTTTRCRRPSSCISRATRCVIGWRSWGYPRRRNCNQRLPPSRMRNGECGVRYTHPYRDRERRTPGDMVEAWTTPTQRSEPRQYGAVVVRSVPRQYGAVVVSIRTATVRSGPSSSPARSGIKP